MGQWRRERAGGNSGFWGFGGLAVSASPELMEKERLGTFLPGAPIIDPWKGAPGQVPRALQSCFSSARPGVGREPGGDRTDSPISVSPRSGSLGPALPIPPPPAPIKEDCWGQIHPTWGFLPGDPPERPSYSAEASANTPRSPTFATRDLGQAPSLGRGTTPQKDGTAQLSLGWEVADPSS